MIIVVCQPLDVCKIIDSKRLESRLYKQFDKIDCLVYLAGYLVDFLYGTY